jgi:alkanesulfonate monooxygenase SsuD/methylene tetrahydromethanopterin reductase-like flavin-dependent oxidoreductase (luciferase family)
MEYGAHLPLISFRGERRTLDDLIEFTETARDHGYAYLCANDHLVFSRPWLDGPTALAAVLSRSGRMNVATTVCLPVVRGPVQTAKLLAALDQLSGGRLVVGVGPGSSARDYALAGLRYEERWMRLDEAIAALRAFFRGQPLQSAVYGSSEERLEPLPVRNGGPPIWLGSWGAKGGLRRTAQRADGWLASGYNTTPTRFARSWARIGEHLRAQGKDPAHFPNAIATMWTYVTEDRAEADALLTDVLAPMLRRPIAELREQLPIGPAEQCARILRAYRDAGAQRVFLWPLANEPAQLVAFRERVMPLVGEN